MRIIVPVVLILVFGLFGAAVLLMGFNWVSFERPIAEQPIAFPHNKHAGNLNLQCTKCHVYVEKSRFAGIPAMKICMECHENAPSQTPEVDKLKNYWKRQEPIPWVKIHNVPSHVYFSHKRHIKAGVQCESCHGDMTVVTTVKRVRSFEMGFCVSCHRANNAPQDCWTCHK